MSEKLRTGWAAKFSARAVSRAALGCLLGAAVLATGTPARAGDDDNANVPIDTKVLRGIMESLGLRRDGEAITYEERAPLVIPPSHDLPPPERSGAALANNPAWPNDPDVRRRKLEAKQERAVSMNPDETLQNEQRPLRPNEMAPGPKPRKTRQTDDGYRASPDGYGGTLSPSQLGTPSNFWSKMFGKDDAPEAGRFTGEPPRAALTEPPAGYQTPSPDQPYGVGKANEAPKAKNYLESHGVVDGGTN